MKRRAPLTSDPEKIRAWKARTSAPLKRAALAAGTALKRLTGLMRHPQPTTGFRRWVRAALTCCVPGCGLPNPDPHHVQARGGGRRDPWKVDRANVVPLCRGHHQLGDSPGWSWSRFEAEHHIDLGTMALTVWWEWMALEPEVRAEWETKAYRENRRRGVPEERARPRAT